MLKYVLKRIFWAALVLFGVTLITYVSVRMMPSDFVDNWAASTGGGRLEPGQIDAVKKLFGLDDNSFFGVIKGYFTWLFNVFRGDLGTSFTSGDSVANEILKNMWLSFSMAFVAFVLQMFVAIPLGITCATHQYGRRDYAITVGAMALISLPSFFLSALLIKFFAVDLGWFPVMTYVNPGADRGNLFMELLDHLHHLILPMLTVLLLSVGGLIRYTRANTLEVLGADYIRTARAKGLSETKVIYKHAFRNTMIPIVTILAGVLPSLFGGMMIVERVFAIPGVGLKAYNAMSVGDVPFIMGYVLFISVLTVIGVFLSDIMYAVVDPRVKLTK